jgi:feruloyl esterase
MSGMTAKWAQSAQATQAVPISAAKGAAVYAAQLAACDAADGVVDGIISNPEACHFNLLSMACSGNGNAACLTAPEIQTIATLRSDLTDANGRVIGAPWGLGDPSQANGSSTGLGSGFLALAFGVASYDISTFNQDRDFGRVKTVLDNVYGMSGGLTGITSYLKKGKKLIVYHVGRHDRAALHQSPVLCGTAKVRGPGRGERTAVHVPGDGALPRRCRSRYRRPRGRDGQLGRRRHAAQRLARRGKALRFGAVTMTRPLCGYPRVPMYVGGDPNAASSFACVAANSAQSQPADE